MAAGAALSINFVFLNVYPFLAVTDRTDTNFLVVEGWIHKYALHAAVEDFRNDSYERVFATGGPVVGNGGYVNDQQTSASVAAQLLVKTGLSGELVQMVPSRINGRDRTYSSAVALRKWFQEHDVPVRSFNIVTEDVHARRSRLLFQKAFGEAVNVGVIAVPNPDYDAKHWWRYSEGIKDVISEASAYIYAKLFFYPKSVDDT
jgi:uncharacterized SAM-binding protein YcdF (DUF218 family)